MIIIPSLNSNTASNHLRKVWDFFINFFNSDAVPFLLKHLSHTAKSSYTLWTSPGLYSRFHEIPNTFYKIKIWGVWGPIYFCNTFLFTLWIGVPTVMTRYIILHKPKFRIIFCQSFTCRPQDWPTYILDIPPSINTFTITFNNTVHLELLALKRLYCSWSLSFCFFCCSTDFTSNTKLSFTKFNPFLTLFPLFIKPILLLFNLFVEGCNLLLSFNAFIFFL